MVVKEELRKLGLHFIVVDLGEVEIMENISAERSVLKHSPKPQLRNQKNSRLNNLPKYP